MSELNREQIIKALECCGTENKCCSVCPLAKDYSPCSKTMAENALSLIEELTVELEARHGKWVFGKLCGRDAWVCSLCGAGFTGENAEWIAKEHDFCPKCGAKMDGERS